MTGGFDVLINNQSELSRWYIDYREVSAQLSRICRGYGLGLDELLFLEQLTINGTQLPGQLAETFKMSHPGITRKLNLLQERNLVKKSAVNGKTYALSILRLQRMDRRFTNKSSQKLPRISWMNEC